jgi:hypothetical protein
VFPVDKKRETQPASPYQIDAFETAHRRLGVPAVPLVVYEPLSSHYSRQCVYYRLSYTHHGSANKALAIEKHLLRF